MQFSTQLGQVSKCYWSAETLGPALFVSAQMQRKVIHYRMITQQPDWLRQSNCEIIEKEGVEDFFLSFCLS